MYILTPLLAIMASLSLTLSHPLTTSSTSLTTSSTTPTTTPTAAPAPATKKDPSTCIAQSWSIIGFSTYTAPVGAPAPGTPAIFGSSRITFRVSDPNTGLETSCFRVLEAGKGGSVANRKKWFECEDRSVKYLFDGEVLDVRHKFKCGSKTITAEASIQGNVNCQERYGGQLCQTDINEVPTTPHIVKK